MILEHRATALSSWKFKKMTILDRNILLFFVHNGPEENYVIFLSTSTHHPATLCNKFYLIFSHSEIRVRCKLDPIGGKIDFQESARPKFFAHCALTGHLCWIFLVFPTFHTVSARLLQKKYSAPSNGFHGVGLKMHLIRVEITFAYDWHFYILRFSALIWPLCKKV